MTGEMGRCAQGGHVERYYRASMRPRQNDRGNHATAHATQRNGECPASMRPRQNDRGNALVLAEQRLGEFSASMRPRQNDRGNMALVRALHASLSELQ